MESLNQGVMKVLNITKGDMIQMFDSIYSDTEKEPWKWVEDFCQIILWTRNSNIYKCTICHED